MDILDNSSELTLPEAVSARPTGLRWGVAAGFLTVIFSLISWQISQNTVRPVGFHARPTALLPLYLFNLLCVAAYMYICYRAIKEYRDQKSGGYITLGKCIVLGLWIGLVAGLFDGAYVFLRNDYMQIQPDSKETELRKKARDKLIENGQSRESANQAMGYPDGLFSIYPWIIFIKVGGALFCFLGFVAYSFFTGLFMQRQRPYQAKMN